MAAGPVMWAYVTRVDGVRAWVTVPDLGGGVELGPCEALASAGELVDGQRVLVASVGGVPEDLVVLGGVAGAP